MKTQLIPLRTSHSLSRAVLEYPFFRHAQDQVARLVQSARIRGAKLVELGLIKGALIRWAMRLKVARVQILSRDVFILTGRFFRDLKLCVRAHSGRIVVHRLGAPPLSLPRAPIPPPIFEKPRFPERLRQSPPPRVALALYAAVGRNERGAQTENSAVRRRSVQRHTAPLMGMLDVDDERTAISQFISPQASIIDEAGVPPAKRSRHVANCHMSALNEYVVPRSSNK